jgi:predicted GH43/DUF377 family glycosyl hydrolase
MTIALEMTISLVMAIALLSAYLYVIQDTHSASAANDLLYVDSVTGEDTGSCGTSIAPCQTLSHTVHTRATGGERIQVAQGIYTENVTIDKPLTLIGGYSPADSQWLTGTGESIIDGSNRHTIRGEWDGEGVARPVVIQDDGGFKMWYDGIGLDQDVKVGLATSSDGLLWNPSNANPVLTGTLRTWDARGEHAPFVLKEDGLYKMWYEGEYGGIRRLGYATSTNGIDWQKYAGNPLLTPGPDGFDQTYVGHGTIIREDGTYKLWYHADGDRGHVIAYATSPDGVTGWTKAGAVLETNTGGWDDTSIWGPTVVKVGGTYWMWYSAQSSTYGGAIGVVTSTDGLNWQRFTVGPVLTATSQAIADPHVISDSGRLMIWYQDWQEGVLNVAESQDGINWTVLPESPALTPGASGEWGQPVISLVAGSAGSVLEGLTIRNGDADAGGGILVGEHAEATIRKCRIIHNHASLWARGGAGVMVNLGRAALSANYIMSNTVHDGSGGGVLVINGTVTLTNNVIAMNRGDLPWNGDGITVWGDTSDATIINNTIVSNTAEGIQVSAGTAHITNTIIAHNNGGIHNIENDATVTANYNLLWMNNWNYDGVLSGTHDLAADPLFVNTAGTNYRLQAASPAINAGTAGGAPETDIAGDDRIDPPDIGAYERGYVYIFLPVIAKP